MSILLKKKKHFFQNTYYMIQIHLVFGTANILGLTMQIGKEEEKAMATHSSTPAWKIP